MRLHVPITLRWSDLDAYQHVNNVEMFRILEEARIVAFWLAPDAEPADRWPTAVVDSGPQATTHTFVARQEIEYLRPLGYTRLPLQVEMWLGKIGGASLDICYAVHDGSEHAERIGPALAGAPYARAVATLVMVDARTGAPRRITDAERSAWEPFREERIGFRRR
ncbi:MAG: acyl-CoA thioesterase [Cellulomonadaceae bacterium]